MDKEEFGKIVLSEKEKSLHISRIPENTKEIFVEIAKEEFCEDYGMTLKWCLDQALEYQQLKSSLVLHSQIEKNSSIRSEEKPDEIKMLSGRRAKGRCK